MNLLLLILGVIVAGVHTANANPEQAPMLGRLMVSHHWAFRLGRRGCLHSLSIAQRCHDLEVRERSKRKRKRSLQHLCTRRLVL
jgi:hypothetical protein